MNKSEANQFYTLTFDLYCICLSVVCLFVGLFMKEIIAILLTNKYSDSLFVAAVLCFSNFIYSLNVIGATGMAREKKIYYFGIIVSAFNLITIGLIYFLTLLYGINGAATAFIFGQSMAIVFIFYYSQKAYFIPYRILANAFSIIISGLFFLVGYYSISIYPFLSLYIRVGLFLLFIVFLLICYKNIWVRAKMIFANVRSDSSKEIIDRNLNKHQTF